MSHESEIERLMQLRREALQDAATYIPYTYDAPWLVVGYTDGGEILEGTRRPNPTADNDLYLDALGRRDAIDAQIQALLAEFPRPDVDTV
jgi:hypothetical protein